MKDILFFYSASNTVGLYISFARELKKHGNRVLFIDVSGILGKAPPEDSYEKLRMEGIEIKEYSGKLEIAKTYLDYCRIIEDILDCYTPSLVVVPYEFHFFYYLVQISKQNNIKVLHVQHGLWGPGKFLPGYNINPDISLKIKKTKIKKKIKNWLVGAKQLILKNNNEKWNRIDRQMKECLRLKKHFPLNSNYIAVPSHYYKKQVLDEVPGYKKKNILEVGYLRGDLLIEDNIDIYKLFNIPKEKKIISYFFSPFHMYPDRFKELYSSDTALIEFLQECNSFFKGESCYFLVLIHPTIISYASKISKRIQESGIKNYVVSHSQNAQGAIYKESYIIAGAKTGALTEASLFSSKVLRQTYILEGRQEEFQMEQNLVHEVSGKDKIKKVLKEVTKPTSIKENKILGVFDGKSGQRLYQSLRDRGVF